MSQQGARSGVNPVLAILLVIAVIALAVLGYRYYRQQHQVMKIDVPGFQGTISKDNGGVDIEVGKHK